MKKLLSFLAVALLVVACANEEKKPLTVEEQAKAYVEDMIDALNEGNAEEFKAVGEAVEAWQAKLSEEDKTKAEEAVKEYEEEFIEALMKNISNPDFINLMEE